MASRHHGRNRRGVRRNILDRFIYRPKVLYVGHDTLLIRLFMLGWKNGLKGFKPVSAPTAAIARLRTARTRYAVIILGGEKYVELGLELDAQPKHAGRVVISTGGMRQSDAKGLPTYQQPDWDFMRIVKDVLKRR